MSSLSAITIIFLPSRQNFANLAGFCQRLAAHSAWSWGHLFNIKVPTKYDSLNKIHIFWCINFIVPWNLFDSSRITQVSLLIVYYLIEWCPAACLQWALMPALIAFTFSPIPNNSPGGSLSMPSIPWGLQIGNSWGCRGRLWVDARKSALYFCRQISPMLSPINFEDTARHRW